jgi:DNA-binding response OmpR family regulator
MCTVKGHPRDLLHGWTLGCDGYVWKPFDLKLLADEVSTVVDRNEAERARVRGAAIDEVRLLLRSAV